MIIRTTALGHSPNDTHVVGMNENPADRKTGGVGSINNQFNRDHFQPAYTPAYIVIDMGGIPTRTEFEGHPAAIEKETYASGRASVYEDVEIKRV